MLSFFPQDALDEIWDLIESVSDGGLTYFSLLLKSNRLLKNISQIHIVWMEPTSVYVFVGCTRLGWAFAENDATYFVI